MPHANVPKWAEGTREFVRRIKDASYRTLLLNQEAVVIIDGDSQRVLGQ